MKKPFKRPDFIANRRDVEAPAAPPVSPEDFGFASELGEATGMTHLRTAHLRVPPGLRAYPPIAMHDIEIFAFVLEGAPDLWLDGHLHRLRQGDGVCLNAGTGIAHSLINNGAKDARIFVCTDAMRRNSKCVHPADRGANENLKKLGMLWADAPIHKRGPNSGGPGDKSGARNSRPDFVVNWKSILKNKAKRYPDSTEDQGIDAPFGSRARFSRIGVHFEVLKAGRRTSYPHAERDEEEFVYVVSGKVDAWNDGRIAAMGEGDLIGWKIRTGITHVILNNCDEDALLIVGGESSRVKNQFWYPYHPSRNKAAGDRYWADHPVPKLGAHDGMPDALRARLSPKARKSALAANIAALKVKPERAKRRRRK